MQHDAWRERRRRLRLQRFLEDVPPRLRPIHFQLKFRGALQMHADADETCQDQATHRHLQRAQVRGPRARDVPRDQSSVSTIRTSGMHWSRSSKCVQEQQLDQRPHELEHQHGEQPPSDPARAVTSTRSPIVTGYAVPGARP